MNEEILIELGEVSEKTMGLTGCYSEIEFNPVAREPNPGEDKC